jgi:hypothetical protein
LFVTHLQEGQRQGGSFKKSERRENINLDIAILKDEDITLPCNVGIRLTSDAVGFAGRTETYSKLVCEERIERNSRICFKKVKFSLSTS